MILQLGVKRSWFNTFTILDKGHYKVPRTPSSTGDLRSYMINSPPVGDAVVPELLLKVLEPYRKEGRSFVVWWFGLFCKRDAFGIWLVCLFSHIFIFILKDAYLMMRG